NWFCNCCGRGAQGLVAQGAERAYVWLKHLLAAQRVA
ncbi:hypothetical protein A2U01_0097114, partial [Trifolium medium]|nr:hypothetical protein [Trifolium medium]